MLAYNIYRFIRHLLRWLRILDAAIFLIKGLVFVLDKLNRTEQWTALYLVVARKK
jgi:hypothetical protein